MSEYGPLTQLVSNAGWVMAAAGAIILSFKGRAKWEPAEEDVSKAPQKIASLASAVIIAVLAATTGPDERDLLIALAIGSVSACVFFLLLYGYLVSVHTFESTKVLNTATGSTEKIKIIGGFRLTNHAKETISKNRLTVQRFLEGARFDPDEVWTRGSRGLTKQLFVAAYIGMIGCGAVGLASASLLLGITERHEEPSEVTTQIGSTHMGTRSCRTASG